MNLKYLLTIGCLCLCGTTAFGSVSLDVPDREGMTLKGVVYCGETPLAGVQVSDGYEVTLTDEQGVYYLPSQKQCGYVFICNPNGYKVKNEGLYPQFYQNLSAEAGKTDVEQFNFELEKETSSDYVVLMLADIQMANRNSDTRQFGAHSLPDINATAAKYQEAGKSVYAITLGDQAFDKYWTENRWGIPDSKRLMDNMKVNTLYNCMGNHDNNPDVAGDWDASITYRQIWGPTYYSFNAGGIHYVVLDNIEYKNPKANVDDRSYSTNIVPQVMNWFKKDVAALDRNTTLVICMHAPMFSRQQCDDNGAVGEPSIRYNYGYELYETVKDFNDVRIFTGHSHLNYSIVKDNVIEYNVAAVCANLWWTGQNTYMFGNNVSHDGSPAGYRVVDVTDGVISDTYYKSVGIAREVQFRAYDLNECNITYQRFCPKAKYGSELEQWLNEGKYGYDNTEYSDGVANEPNKILLNVFCYDPRWKVEMFENGSPLTVKRVNRYDPYYIISGACLRLRGNSRLLNTGSFNPTGHSKFFEAQASSATSTVTVKVTDEFGNIFVEEMKRPKEFSIKNYKDGSPIAGLQDVDNYDVGAPVEYYDLRGIRVDCPSNGIFIRRQGSTVKKIIIR